MARRVAVAWAWYCSQQQYQRERSDRVFRDIHGAESAWHPNIVASTPTETGDTTGDDDVLRRHWVVVCADRARCLPHGKWSVSGYRRGTNYIQGFTNVGDFAGTFGVGIRDRAEIFGSFLFDTRIDRDVRPLFMQRSRHRRLRRPLSARERGLDAATTSATATSAPRSTSGRSTASSPAALALRGMVKVPTGDDDSGASTGKADFFVDFIGSKETLRSGVEVAGYAGYEWRGEPDGFEMPGGAFRWGAGVGVPVAEPAARHLRAERHRCPAGDTIDAARRRWSASTESIAPLPADTGEITRATSALN